MGSFIVGIALFDKGHYFGNVLLAFKLYFIVPIAPVADWLRFREVASDSIRIIKLAAWDIEKNLEEVKMSVFMLRMEE